MMEWLKKILEGAEVTDGALNAEALQNTIEKEFPKYAIPKTQFNEVNEKLKTANETIEQLKKDNQDNELLQQQVNAYKTKVEELETAAADTQKEYALREKLAGSRRGRSGVSDLQTGRSGKVCFRQRRQAGGDRRSVKAVKGIFSASV